MPNDQLTLDEPFAVPEPERVECDVSPEPWIEGATPSDAGRMPWRVPREVAVRVHTNKNLAAAQVAKDFVVTTVLADLTKATQPLRDTLTRLDREYREAEQAGASAAQLTAIQGLQLAPRQQAQGHLRAAVQRTVDPVREQLHKAERAAMQELEERPGIAPTAADYTQASELADTLKLLPAPFAAKMLMNRLVIEPAKTGKVGLTAAVLPLLRAQMAEPSYAASAEFKDVLDLCQIVTRDAAYHTAHQRLRMAGTLRHKLDRLTEDAVALHGHTAAARNAFYKELGAVAISG